jgi:hypothetical protein
LKRGIAELKDHRWFMGGDGDSSADSGATAAAWDWGAMLKQQAVPPFVPRVTSKTDMTYFVEQDDKEEPALPPYIPTSGTADPFAGF